MLMGILPKVRIEMAEGYGGSGYYPKVFEQDENGEFTQEMKWIRNFSWKASVEEQNVIYITLIRQVAEVDAEVEAVIVDEEN